MIPNALRLYEWRWSVYIWGVPSFLFVVICYWYETQSVKAFRSTRRQLDRLSSFQAHPPFSIILRAVEIINLHQSQALFMSQYPHRISSQPPKVVHHSFLQRSCMNVTLTEATPHGVTLNIMPRKEVPLLGSPETRAISIINIWSFIFRLVCTPVGHAHLNIMSSSFPPDELRQIVKEVATLLKERKETISVAETVCI
jgi:hypothetical protein